MHTLDSPPGAQPRSAAGAAPDPGALYERDLYAWASTQAALLRSGHLAQADIEHIAEELEEETFAPVCPYTIEQVMDDRWLPGSDSTEPLRTDTSRQSRG